MKKEFRSVVAAVFLSISVSALAAAESSKPFASTTTIVAQAFTWNGFRPGSVTPEIHFATSECREVKMLAMEVGEQQIDGRWRHPKAKGKISISRVSDGFRVEWTGNPIRSTHEEVKIDGKSLLVEIDFEHAYGFCEIDFRLSRVLN